MEEFDSIAVSVGGGDTTDILELEARGRGRGRNLIRCPTT